MPASTLHKSAQQGAPDTYISLCKSTIQDMRVPRRYTRLSLHAPRGTCISQVRVQEMPALAPCARPKDARAILIRALERYVRRCPLCARPGHACTAPCLCTPKMAAPTYARAKMHALLLPT